MHDVGTIEGSVHVELHSLYHDWGKNSEQLAQFQYFAYGSDSWQAKKGWYYTE